MLLVNLMLVVILAPRGLGQPNPPLLVALLFARGSQLGQQELVQPDQQ